MYFVALAVFGLVTFLGVTNMDFNRFLKSHTNNPNVEERIIALTFDDGPSEYTPKLLDLLARHQQKATFFCIGTQIIKYPEIFQSIAAEGHEVGNHTFSHSNATGFLTTFKMKREIIRNDRLMLKKAGIQTDLYRPPFGITNPNIARAISKTGKKCIGWDIRSFDTSISDEKKILNRILPKIKPGSVILLHDTSDKSCSVLEEILLFLERENYRSVTVSELFNFKK
ncbi:polysaccharide deacetylase family protein [Marnyiella aurantia]|uniref:Polysaccharide deacetylase family protein n=2 Tax=Marnyiella aurantia TaxID=2758037 RepID=A0A7D7RM51_9FLAO|nr:polysaccharide deacetylase family protein [Marnyiella aurantia]QMS99592.1 polysaccharide deacetylase family protein [Marnyiella aurantia]